MVEPVSEPQDRERAEFEKWADGRVTGQLIGLERDGAGYKAEAVQRSWEVWQAARREERKRTLGECAEISRDDSAWLVDERIRYLLAALEVEENGRDQE